MGNLINEMKKNSGVSLNESDISQVKMMNAESRLIGAFGSLLRELQWIQRDAEPNPIPRYGYGHRGYGGGCGSPQVDVANPEEIERLKSVDKVALYKIAKEKLAIVEKEIAKTFKVEMKSKDEDDDEDDDDDEE